MATPMQTFLHEHAPKLAGKRIALFATSGSSGITTSVSEARSLCPDATIIDRTLLLTSSSLSQMATRVPAWLDEIGASRENPDTPEASAKVNVTVGGRMITATMEDNAAGRDFLSRLPLEVTLNDYNNVTEKIFYPSPALTTDGVTRGCAPHTRRHHDLCAVGQCGDFLQELVAQQRPDQDRPYPTATASKP